jgi:hypothetical protein
MKQVVKKRMFKKKVNIGAFDKKQNEKIKPSDREIEFVERIMREFSTSSGDFLLESRYSKNKCVFKSHFASHLDKNTNRLMVRVITCRVNLKEKGKYNMWYGSCEHQDDIQKFVEKDEKDLVKKKRFRSKQRKHEPHHLGRTEKFDCSLDTIDEVFELFYMYFNFTEGKLDQIYEFQKRSSMCNVNVDVFLDMKLITSLTGAEHCYDDEVLRHKKVCDNTLAKIYCGQSDSMMLTGHGLEVKTGSLYTEQSPYISSNICINATTLNAMNNMSDETLKVHFLSFLPTDVLPFAKRMTAENIHFVINEHLHTLLFFNCYYLMKNHVINMKEEKTSSGYIRKYGIVNDIYKSVYKSDALLTYMKFCIGYKSENNKKMKFPIDELFLSLEKDRILTYAHLKKQEEEWQKCYKSKSKKFRIELENLIEEYNEL